LAAARCYEDRLLHVNKQKCFYKKNNYFCNHQRRMAKEIGGFRGSNKVHRD